MKLILVRHGATEWSENGRHTGRTDLPLIAAGRAQAEQARRRVLAELGDEQFVLWSSPLRRASETAAILFGDRPCSFDARLSEFDYGDLEGLTNAQIVERIPGWTVWDGCPGGESLDQVVQRVDSFLAELRLAMIDTHLVVAHSHLLRAFGARALAQPAAFGRHLTLDTASVSVIDDYRGAPRIVRWNSSDC